MTNPNPLAQSVIDQINEISGLDNVPAPGPNQKTNTRPAAADQPAETAYGVCHFPDNNLDAAILVIKDWHAKVSEQCRSDLAAILTDLQDKTAAGQTHQRGWLLVWLMPLYESDNANELQTVINHWQAGTAFFGRGTKEYCAEQALHLLVKTGYTPEQADDRMAQALMAIFQNHLAANSDPLCQISDSEPD